MLGFFFSEALSCYILNTQWFTVYLKGSDFVLHVPVKLKFKTVFFYVFKHLCRVLSLKCVFVVPRQSLESKSTPAYKQTNILIHSENVLLILVWSFRLCFVNYPIGRLTVTKLQPVKKCTDLPPESCTDWNGFFL